MANALWKKEVVIRQNSTISIGAAQDWTRNWLASFQDDADNIDGSGEYIDYFFGDLFDARTGNLYRIFSDASGTKYNMQDVVFTVLETSKFVPWTSVSNDPNLANDPDKISTRGSILQYANSAMQNAWTTLRELFWAKEETSNDANLATDEDFLITRSGLSDVLDSFISTASVVNDAGVLDGDTMTLANIPSGGIIGGKCNVKIGASNTYDEVECEVNGTTLTVLPDTSGEYDGAICIVSYLINS
jgi:hypothetical protein